MLSLENKTSTTAEVTLLLPPALETPLLTQRYLCKPQLPKMMSFHVALQLGQGLGSAPPTGLGVIEMKSKKNYTQ